MSMVVANGVSFAQTAYSDAGLTINSGTTNPYGMIAGETWWTSAANGTPYTVKTFTSSSEEGVYLINGYAMNENYSLSTLPTWYWGALIRTSANIQFISYDTIYITMSRGTTLANNDTWVVTSGALDGTRTLRLSWVKVL